MKVIKTILGIIFLLIVLLAIGAFFLYKNIDGLAKQAIEKVGSDITQTAVAVDSVKLELTEGRGAINGLTIANPQGFSDEKIFVLGTTVLQIAPTSIRDEVIVLNEILIDGAKLRLEHQNVADTNIQALMNNVRASLGTGEEEPAETPSGKEPRFMVERLKFVNISMDMISPHLENRTLTLRDIERSNLGSRQQGLTAKELGMAIIQPLIDEARAKFEAEVKDRAGSKLKEKLDEKLSDKDKEKIDELKSILGR